MYLFFCVFNFSSFVCLFIPPLSLVFVYVCVFHLCVCECAHVRAYSCVSVCVFIFQCSGRPCRQQYRQLLWVFFCNTYQRARTHTITIIGTPYLAIRCNVVYCMECGNVGGNGIDFQISGFLFPLLGNGNLDWQAGIHSPPFSHFGNRKGGWTAGTNLTSWHFQKII